MALCIANKVGLEDERLIKTHAFNIFNRRVTNVKFIVWEKSCERKGLIFAISQFISRFKNHTVFNRQKNNKFYKDFLKTILRLV